MSKGEGLTCEQLFTEHKPLRHLVEAWGFILDRLDEEGRIDDNAAIAEATEVLEERARQSLEFHYPELGPQIDLEEPSAGTRTRANLWTTRALLLANDIREIAIQTKPEQST
jgi:hypothetical protein